MNIGQTTDYLYCEPCHEYVALLRYGTYAQNPIRVEQSGHSDHDWRYITDQELIECPNLPIYLELTRYDIELLLRGLRLLRYNALEGFNEEKKHIPRADYLISTLWGVVSF